SGSSSGIFYGWWIVASSIVILFASSGVGFYAHGVILDPLRAQYGWSKGVVSSAITLYFATSACTGIFVGQKIDKYGPKPFLIGGALVFSCCYFLLSRIDQVWQLFFVYFLVAIGWSGSSLLAVNTLITNWFVQKRGLAMSITMTGLSLGGHGVHVDDAATDYRRVFWDGLFRSGFRNDWCLLNHRLITRTDDCGIYL
ncbi:MAG: MFS transporter, partial [SAR324 cluster bacterium]|nr:MFS transporter [SAR324 cluster bacterium]